MHHKHATKTLIFTAALLLGYSLIFIHQQLPLKALFSATDQLPLDAAIIKSTLIPELIVALLAGGLLALISLSLQLATRNILASETTLGLQSGAQLALIIGTLFLPSIALLNTLSLALIGTFTTLALVFYITLKNQISSLSLILTGMLINILFAAIASLLLLVYWDFLQGILLWSSGSLAQEGFSVSNSLILIALITLPLIFLFIDKFKILLLDEQQAKALGSNPLTLRLILFLYAGISSAMLASLVGIIPFTGLIAAVIAHTLAQQNLKQRALFAFSIGALMLLSLSLISQTLSHNFNIHLPAGALSGIIGAPLLLIILLIERKKLLPKNDQANTPPQSKKAPSLRLCLALLLIITFALLLFAPTAKGYTIAPSWEILYQYRLPRTLSAISAGMILAVSGVLLQRLSHNPMASPEILGISSAACIALLIAFLINPDLSQISYLLIASLGAFLMLLFILHIARTLSPNYLLLIGIAVTALMTATLNIARLSSDPRLSQILSFLSGSTYHNNAQLLYPQLIIASLLCLSAYLMIPPLKPLQLGISVAHGLGVNIKKQQLILLLIIALISALSTLSIGPLSFIGLMAPHLAHNLGAQQLKSQLTLALLLGGILMAIADYLGRYLIYPYEIPAGIIASIIGASYFIYLIKQGKT